MLKILAVLVGLLIAIMVLLKISGFHIGYRIAENVFALGIAGTNLNTWILGLLVLVEMFLIYYLFTDSQNQLK